MQHTVIVRAIVDVADYPAARSIIADSPIVQALATWPAGVSSVAIVDPEPDRAAGAREQARAQAESIAQMIAATRVDFERLEELRAKRKAGCYSVGWNMPGYMPDSEPFRVDTCDEAREALADELARHADDEENDAAAGPMLEARDALRELTGDKDADFGQTIGQYHYWLTHCPGELADDDEREELEELEAAAGDCENEDDAWQRIDEDPLSVQVRRDWEDPHGEPADPSEFEILLCTGGPAVRIRGELDESGEPSRAWLEYQDWGTRWTKYHGEGVESSDLLAYCARFFGG